MVRLQADSDKNEAAVLLPYQMTSPEAPTVQGLQANESHEVSLIIS